MKCPNYLNSMIKISVQRIYGKIQDNSLESATEEVDKAKEWLSKIYLIEPDDNGARVLVNRKSYIFTRTFVGEVLSEPRELSLLLYIHGYKIMEEYFGDIQKQFLLALKEISVAECFLMNYYDIILSEENNNYSILISSLNEKLANPAPIEQSIDPSVQEIILRYGESIISRLVSAKLDDQMTA